MISERALERTVMDESSGNVQFKTQKNMANQREFVELASRQTTAFRHSVRLVREKFRIKIISSFYRASKLVWRTLIFFRNPLLNKCCQESP